MRRTLAVSALLSATLFSIATSAPTVQWSVQGHDKLTDALDRDTDRASWGIDITVNELALSIPARLAEPVPPGEGEPFELFTSSLDLQVELLTKGTFGIGANETDATVRLFDEAGGLVATETVFVEPFEPTFVDLSAAGILAHCELNAPCDAAFEVEIETSDRSRLKAKIEARVRLNGPGGIEAPEDAEVDVEIFAL